MTNKPKPKKEPKKALPGMYCKPKKETLRNQPGASRKTGGDHDGGAKAKEQVPGEGNSEIGRENEEGKKLKRDLDTVL